MAAAMVAGSTKGETPRRWGDCGAGVAGWRVAAAQWQDGCGDWGSCSLGGLRTAIEVNRRVWGCGGLGAETVGFLLVGEDGAGETYEGELSEKTWRFYSTW